MFKKKDKSPEVVKLGNELTHKNQNANREVKNTEATNAGTVKNTLLKSSNNQEKVDKAGEVNQEHPQRPSNPFFKSSIK